MYTRAGARGCVCAAYIHTRCLGMHDHFTLHEKQAEADERFASTASLLKNPRAIEEGAIAEGFLIGRLSIDSRQSRVRDKLEIPREEPRDHRPAKLPAFPRFEKRRGRGGGDFRSESERACTHVRRTHFHRARSRFSRADYRLDQLDGGRELAGRASSSRESPSFTSSVTTISNRSRYSR